MKVGGLVLHLPALMNFFPYFSGIVSWTMKGPHITSQVQGAAFKETLSRYVAVAGGGSTAGQGRNALGRAATRVVLSEHNSYRPAVLLIIDIGMPE